VESSAKQLKKMFDTVPSIPFLRPNISISRLWQLFVVLLMATDVVMIAISLELAYGFRFQLDFNLFALDIVPNVRFYLILGLIMIPVWILIFALNGLYQKENLLGGIKEYSLVFRSINSGMLLVIIATFLEPELSLARGWLVVAWFFAQILVGLNRFLLRRFVYYSRRYGFFLTPTLIIGMNQEGYSLAQQLVGWYTSGLNVLGFINDGVGQNQSLSRRLPQLGEMSDLDHLIRKHNIQELIVVTSAISREEITSIFERYGRQDDINLRLSSGLFEIMTTGLEVKEVANVPLVRVNHLRLKSTERIAKLFLDYFIVVVGGLFMLPLLGLIALLVKLDSPGPIIYRRQVMGINGKQFAAYKFRTMHVNGDEILAQHPELLKKLKEDHKLKDDPRVTRVGHYLRKLSLDELPQLLNILKREMAVVGPRIISPGEMEQYGQWGMNLLSVHPGLTGLWQVSGRSDVSYEERVWLDMNYIRNWSIWSDIHIILRTLPAVLKSQGAY
jgi:exopolysaccharide biosynthesis polyprenyl glycosylphosphotransferase